MDYLSTLEETLSKTITFRYILFYDDKHTAVGLAITQLIHFNSSGLKFQEVPCSVSDAIKNAVFKNLDVKVLICGNIFSCGEHGFLYHKDLINDQDAFEMLSHALRKIRKTEHLEKPSFILLKEFWPESFAQSDHIKNHDFREFKIDVNMVLELQKEWTTFEDYLSSMRTKFRTRTKKVFEQSQELKVKDLNPEDIEHYGNEIDALYLSVIEKADFKIGKLNAHTFKNLKLNLGDQFMVKGYFLDQKLVGFISAFVVDDAIDANHIGIDYDFNKSHAIYQRMLYDYVDIAIQHHAQWLRLGRTAEIIKSCVGAKPVEMKLYVRHGNSFSNTILKPLVDLITCLLYTSPSPRDA